MSELEIDFSILAGLFWPFLDAKWGKRVLWFNLEMKSEELEQRLALYITPPQGRCGEEKKNGGQVHEVSTYFFVLHFPLYQLLSGSPAATPGGGLP